MASVPTIVPREAPRTSWSGIFAGTFVFLAIELTFGVVLGMAVFASAANPRAANPVGGMSTGIGIWMIVVSIIALYFAGRAAAHLAGSLRKLSGFYHGLVTFGMSCFAAVLITSMALESTAGSSVNAANPALYPASSLLDVAAKGGWLLWIAMFLGGIAACIGGATAVPGNLQPSAERPGIRTAA